MADMLADAVDWLKDTFQSHASRTITYRRGPHSVSLSATKDLHQHQTDEAYGALEIHEEHWLFPVASLILDGAVTLPKRGDLVDDDTTALRFEVLDSSGSPAWDYEDPYHTLLRVRTKRIGVET